MALVLAAFSFFAVLAAGQSAQEEPGARPETAGADEAASEPQRSTLEVKPGSPVIKDKDIYEATGYFHPFVLMPKYVIHDQKAIWTSPFHTSKDDVKWWGIFGTATAAVIATDRWTVKQLPNSRTQVSISTWG